jgi:sugar phosphate isomerase/epimerase
VFGPKQKPCLPLETALCGLAEAGYTCVELSRKHRELSANADRIASLGLRVRAVHGTLGVGHVFNDETTRREGVQKEILRMHESAPFAPCPYVLHYTCRATDPRATIAYRRSIEELVPTAQALRLTLAIETVPDKFSNERYANSREVADFARSFQDPLVRVCFDVNHSNLGEALADAIANCDGVITTIHVSDNHGETEDHLPPGEGAIDLPAAMQALAAAGYQGPLNMEFHTPGYPTQDTLTAARRWAEAAVAGLS